MISRILKTNKHHNLKFISLSHQIPIIQSRNINTSRHYNIRFSRKHKKFYLQNTSDSNNSSNPPSDSSNGSNGGNDDDNNDKKKPNFILVEENETEDFEQIEYDIANKPKPKIKSESTGVTKYNQQSYLQYKLPHLPYTPIVAVGRRTVFPEFMKHVTITDEKMIDILLKKANGSSPYITIVLKRNDENLNEVVDSIDDVYNVGTLCKIMEFKVTDATAKPVDKDDWDIKLQPRMLQMMCLGIKRIAIKRDISVITDNDEPKIFDALTDQGDDKRFLIGNLKDYHIELKLDPEDEEYEQKRNKQKALCNEIIQMVTETMSKNPPNKEVLQNLIAPRGSSVIQNPYFWCDIAASICDIESSKAQNMLEEKDLLKRLKMAVQILSQELEVWKLQEEVRKETSDKHNEQNKKYMLEQELKTIKKKLGINKDNSEDLVNEYLKRIKDLNVPKEIDQVIQEEIKRFRSLETHSSEYQVVRNYLDWLTIIKWGVLSKDSLDISNSKTILDEDHYSMKDVKSRILEFIAVAKLKGEPTGKIICFHGPPGTGKTSIAKSIAKCLDRKYFRFSVGGITDTSEIKGHRRTYIGAMPGKAIQALKRTKTQNPLILLDEIDKIGTRSHQGDPTAALLELLDPEQNKNFLDHYLDVPVDMSKVLFLCTANDISNIPGPLRDRMEMIEVGGYIHGEKKEIAKRHLIPKSLQETGLKELNCDLDDSALDILINNYCRESGVRNLKKHIEKVHRKTAFRLIKIDETFSKENAPTDCIKITGDNLTDFVGKPVYTKERLYMNPPVGTVCGLAWTGNGGSTLYIESQIQEFQNVDKDKAVGSITITGNLKQVMKESITIAHTVAKHYTLNNKLDDAHNFLNSTKLHVHVPEGATPKDGPSAGVTVTSALLSLASGKPVKSDVAMTGEISLSGHVMPVGGIKEKVLAAKRGGIKTIILPFDNQKDWDDLEQEVKDDVDINFAKIYQDVYDIAF